MNLSMVDRSGVLSQRTRELAERRLRSALERFAHRARSVSLIVEDLNGPRGGRDKRCRLAVNLKGADRVMITDSDSDIGRCIARVADRLANAVGRTLSKAGRRRRKKAVDEHQDLDVHPQEWIGPS